jgi:hypothetical protein
MASVGRPTKRIQLKSTEQIGEVRVVNTPKMEPGQVECPVCGHPATRRKPKPGTDPLPARYDHPFRAFPCRSETELVLTLQELIDAVPNTWP